MAVGYALRETNPSLQLWKKELRVGWMIVQLGQKARGVVFLEEPLFKGFIGSAALKVRLKDSDKLRSCGFQHTCCLEL